MPASVGDIYELQGQRAKLREELADKCRKSFKTFVRAAWKEADPTHPFIHGWHVDAICDHLQAVAEGKIKRICINVAPGVGKSLIVSVLWPSWMWANRPEWQHISATYSLELALRDSVRMRSLVNSKWYRDLFSITWKMKRDVDTKERFENEKGGMRYSASVTGTLTGFRGDCLIYDDLLNPKDLASDIKLEEAISFIDKVASSRLNKLEEGIQVMIMQRLSERDPSAHVVRKGWEHLYIPSEFESGRRCKTSIWEDPRKRDGELMFPALFPRSVIEQAKKDMGTSAFSSQHQQFPTQEGGGVIKEHWWQYWVPKGYGDKLPPVAVKQPDGTTKNYKARELPEAFDAVIQSWDMGFKSTSDSDYVVGEVIAAKGANRFILDLERGRFDFPQTLQAVQDMSFKFPQTGWKLVEDKANGPAVIQMLHDKISGLIAVNPAGGKESRVAAISPQVESGNWYLPHPAMRPWVKGFIEECSSFPMGMYDDQVDAFSQGGIKLVHIKGEDVTVDDVTNGYPSGRSGGGGGHWSA